MQEKEGSEKKLCVGGLWEREREEKKQLCVGYGEEKKKAADAVGCGWIMGEKKGLASCCLLGKEG